MMKVSVIVPVHNSESYLHKCVDSLLAQTLEDTEIILVDDCSTDGSRRLIEDYVNQYPDKVVGLYLRENLRQGGARNRGMDIAKGEYLAFVDSDDFIEPEMLRVLYETADGADMCGADYYIDDGKTLKVYPLDYGQGTEMTPDRRAWFIEHSGFFWSRIYRRDFIEENKLRFPEKTFYEDAYFNFMTALYARSAVKAEGKFYHYYQSENSTMRNRNNPRQYERIGIPSIILNDCKARGIYAQHRDLIDFKYIIMHMGTIRYTCLGQFDKPDVTQLQRIRKAIKAECPRFARCAYYKNTLFQLRVYLRLTLLQPRLAIWADKMDWAVELLAILVKKCKR